MTLSFKDVAEIVKIIDASSCEVVVLEAEGTRLVVRRGGDGSAVAEPAPPPATAPAKSPSSPATAAPAAASPATDAGPDPSDTAPDGVSVNAPMAGTFYRQPNPEDPPYVEPGAKVSAGDPLCMIEVMKLYTTIEATVGGTVAAVLAEDGKLVDFDQPLFIIRAD